MVLKKLWNRYKYGRFIYTINEKHSPSREANNLPFLSRYIQPCRQSPEAVGNDTKPILEK